MELAQPTTVSRDPEDSAQDPGSIATLGLKPEEKLSSAHLTSAEIAAKIEAVKRRMLANASGRDADSVAAFVQSISK